MVSKRFGLHRSQVGREGAKYVPIFCGGKQKKQNMLKWIQKLEVGQVPGGKRVENCRKIDAGHSERISKPEGRVP